MPFEYLHARFPELADDETRSVLLPGERIAFFEMYCNEKRCDCRRVLLRPVPPGGREPLASISFGWEPDAFYREWAGYPLDDADLEELRGPGLQRLVPQGRRADEMLRLAALLLTDRAYVDRIIRHYHAFRATVDRPHTRRTPRVRGERRRRHKERARAVRDES